MDLLRSMFCHNYVEFFQDTNPFFLFSKSTIEAATPPSPSVNYGSGKKNRVTGNIQMISFVWVWFTGLLKIFVHIVNILDLVYANDTLEKLSEVLDLTLFNPVPQRF